MGNYNLFLASTNTSGANFDYPIIGASASTFIKTDGTGVLIKYLPETGFFRGSSFPIGNSSYNPAILFLENFILPLTGDYFEIRVVDEVLSDGTSGTPITQNFVNRTWFINEQTPGGQSVDLYLYWSVSDEQPGFDRNNAGVRHYSNGSWDIPTTWSGSGFYNNQYTRNRNGMTSFSPFSVSKNVSLPVELSHFGGQWTPEDKINLSWSTESELNNEYFEVQYSNNGKDFRSIEKVNGQGTTTRPTSYQYIHDPADGRSHYYRLKQVDFDGSFTYSDVLHFLGKENALMAELNTTGATDQFYLSLSTSQETNIELVINNVAGQIVHHQSATILESTDLNISTKEWPAGIYFITLKAKDSSRFTRRFTYFKP